MLFSRALCVDAKPVNNINFSQSTAQALNVNVSKIFSVLKKLKKSDWLSLFFILMDYVRPENFNSLKFKQNNELLQRFCQIYIEKDFSEDIVVELLTAMKKYQLLREMNVCCHRACIERRISPLWSSLYKVCDNLDDNDLCKVIEKFHMRNADDSAEQVICEVFLKYGQHDLIKGLEELKLDSVSNALNFFIRNHSGNHSRSYVIRQPTLQESCGLAIIINNEKFNQNTLPYREVPFLEERTGSSCDKGKLAELWKNFGFKVESYDNLGADEIEKIFLDLSNREDQDFDVLVVCLMSHGEKNVIYGRDCMPVSIDSLISICANNCPFLNEKPKLFFVQACQGQRQQQGVRVHNSSMYSNFQAESMSEFTNTPEYCDVYKAMSTITDYVSYRDAAVGSLFIVKLVNVLKEYGSSEDIEQSMKRVKEEVSSEKLLIRNNAYKQMPITSSTLRKCVIFKKLS